MTEKEKPKKPYETPKLTILARGNPEEAVLANCKYTAKAGASGSIANCLAYGCSGGCGWGDQQGGCSAYCYSTCNVTKAS
jgi:hypothetical protein